MVHQVGFMPYYNTTDYLAKLETGKIELLLNGHGTTMEDINFVVTCQGSYNSNIHEGDIMLISHGNKQIYYPYAGPQPKSYKFTVFMTQKNYTTRKDQKYIEAIAYINGEFQVSLG